MGKSVFDKPRKWGKLLRLILGAAGVAKKSQTDLGRMAGFERKTMAERLKNPENFTLEEITRLGRGLNIPIEELRQAIMY